MLWKRQEGCGGVGDGDPGRAARLGCWGPGGGCDMMCGAGAVVALASLGPGCVLGEPGWEAGGTCRDSPLWGGRHLPTSQQLCRCSLSHPLPTTEGN